MRPGERQLHLHGRLERLALRLSLPEELLWPVLLSQVSGNNTIWKYTPEHTSLPQSCMPSRFHFLPFADCFLYFFFVFVFLVQESSLLRSCFRSMRLPTRMEWTTVIFKNFYFSYLKQIISKTYFVDVKNLVRMELTAKIARPVAVVRMGAHVVLLMANVSVPADGR